MAAKKTTVRTGPLGKGAAQKALNDGTARKSRNQAALDAAANGLKGATRKR